MAACSAAGWRWARPAAATAAVLGLVIAMLASGLPATADAQDRYSDVTSSSHASHKANIDALDALGVFDGTECGARRFCPGDPAKRWAIAVWIVRVVDGRDPFPVKQSRFADVSDRVWWMPYVERLADLGVTVGCRQEPLSFCPDDTVTRGQMASFLVRAFRLQRANAAGFTDTAGSTHAANIDSLFAAGLTVGCEQRPLRYCAGDSVTRAQMATLLNRGRSGSGGTTTAGGTTSTAPGVGTITTSQGTRNGDEQIAATRGRSCAIRSDETVTCWGGDEGLLAHLSASDLDDVEALSTGNHPTAGLHTCALHDNGRISCWGPGQHGQLGQYNNSTDYIPVRVTDISDAVAVAAGAGFTCAVHRGGDVSCWGTNVRGQLGDGTTDSGRYWPRRVSRLRDIVAITAGAEHSCAIDRSGDLWCWGRVYGTTPTAVAVPDEVTSVSMGGIETCATTTAGLVYCWDYGATKASEMTRVANVTDAVKVSVGDESACVLHLSGQVSCWGRNNVGQVGDGTTTRRATPVHLDGLTGMVDINVSEGSSTVGAHACAMHSDGAVSCWGGNEAGQLEDGTLNDGLTPRRVQLLNRVHSSDVPYDANDLLWEWVDTIVDNRSREFGWLWEAWTQIRGDIVASDSGSGGNVDVVCDGESFGCEVTSMTITDMTLETVIYQLARVYDLHTGIALPRAWGPVQLYFASRYPRCGDSDDLHGAEALAQAMLHVTVPHAQLNQSSLDCPGLPSTPSAEAQRIVRQGLERDVPDWYYANIEDARDLWLTWQRATSFPALANLKNQFGGLCGNTDWIKYPLVPAEFPTGSPFCS